MAMDCSMESEHPVSLLDKSTSPEPEKNYIAFKNSELDFKSHEEKENCSDKESYSEPHSNRRIRNLSCTSGIVANEDQNQKDEIFDSISAENANQKKLKKRTANFTEVEKFILLNLVNYFYNFLEGTSRAKSIVIEEMMRNIDFNHLSRTIKVEFICKISNKLRLMIEYSNISIDDFTGTKKEKIWKRITYTFNQMNNHKIRSAEQLQICYKNMKSKSQKIKGIGRVMKNTVDEVKSKYIVDTQLQDIQNRCNSPTDDRDEEYSTAKMNRNESYDHLEKDVLYENSLQQSKISQKSYIIEKKNMSIPSLEKGPQLSKHIYQSRVGMLDKERSMQVNKSLDHSKEIDKRFCASPNEMQSCTYQDKNLKTYENPKRANLSRSPNGQYVYSENRRYVREPETYDNKNGYFNSKINESYRMGYSDSDGVYPKRNIFSRENGLDKNSGLLLRRSSIAQGETKHYNQYQFNDNQNKVQYHRAERFMNGHGDKHAFDNHKPDRRPHFAYNNDQRALHSAKSTIANHQNSNFIKRDIVAGSPIDVVRRYNYDQKMRMSNNFGSLNENAQKRFIRNPICLSPEESYNSKSLPNEIYDQKQGPNFTHSQAKPSLIRPDNTAHEPEKQEINMINGKFGPDNGHFSNCKRYMFTSRKDQFSDNSSPKSNYSDHAQIEILNRRYMESLIEESQSRIMLVRQQMKLNRIEHRRRMKFYNSVPSEKMLCKIVRFSSNKAYKVFSRPKISFFNRKFKDSSMHRKSVS
ncbi:MAG: hypothetical protein MHPSP_000130 [Paramarteilia canceri]